MKYDFRRDKVKFKPKELNYGEETGFYMFIGIIIFLIIIITIWVLT